MQSEVPHLNTQIKFRTHLLNLNQKARRTVECRLANKPTPELKIELERLLQEHAQILAMN